MLGNMGKESLLKAVIHETGVGAFDRRVADRERQSSHEITRLPVEFVQVVVSPVVNIGTLEQS
jgi:hypothetical protein